MSQFISFYTQFIFIYMLFVVLTYGFMLVVSFIEHNKQYKLHKTETDPSAIDVFFAKPISILVPAHNEEAAIIENVSSLLSLHYPQFELIVINDGSTDKTLETVIRQFRMHRVTREVHYQLETNEVIAVYQSSIHKNLWLIDKVNGGKSDALNAGINLSRYPYFCSIDADSILDKNALIRAMEPIIKSKGKVIATGGSIQIFNGHDYKMNDTSGNQFTNRLIVIMQVIEYLRAFYIGRIALSKFNSVLIVSGAFSVFEKRLVIDVGGYSNNMIGEDMELVVKLHRHIKDHRLDMRIEYVADPIAWTEAPEDLSILRQQRRRWHQGLIDSLWKHKSMAFNPRYGVIGLVAFPYYIFIEMLGPIFELLGYIVVIYAFFTGGIYYEFALLLSILFILSGALLTLTAIILEAWSTNQFPPIVIMLKLVLMSLTDVFWFRPLTIFWRLEGFIRSFIRSNDWGSMRAESKTKSGDVNR